MRPAERAQHIDQLLRIRFVFGCLAHFQRGKADNHGKNILDAMGKLIRQHVTFVECGAHLIDIGDGPEPAYRAAFTLRNRHGEAQHPAP